MVADLQHDQDDDVTRALVIERVQAYVDDGKQPGEAFALVWTELEAAGRVEALARLHGANLVGMLWRAWNSAHRPAAVSRTVARPIHPSGLVHGPAIPGTVLPPAPVAPRRVDLALVRETLDSQFLIDGQWVRLYDMTGPQCMTVAADYRKRSLAAEHNARHLLAIAAVLGDGETVGQKLSEREVLRLYRISKPPGTMLK